IRQFGNSAIRQFGNSAIRQFGNSAIRQFGNSAIRQFGNSLNRSLTLASALILSLAAVAHAQFTNTGTYQPLFWDTDNWVGGDINGIVANGTIGASAVNVGGVSYEANSNVIYTGTYNARQLSIGSFISGDGIPDGAYVTGIDNAGRVTISAVTTGAGTSLTVTNLGRADGYGTVRYASVSASYVATDGTSGILTLSNTTFSGLGARVGQNMRQNTYWVSGQGMNIAEILTATTARVIYPGTPAKNDPFTDQGVEFTTMSWRFDVSGTGVINGDFIYRNSDPWAAQFAVPSTGSAALIQFAARPGGTVNIVYEANRATGDGGFSWGDSGRVVNTDFGGQAVVFQVGRQDLAAQVDNMFFLSGGSNATSLIKTGVGGLFLRGNANQNIILSGGDGVVTVSEGLLSVETSNQNLTGARIRGVTRYDIGQAGATASNANKRNAALFVDLNSVNASQSADVNVLESSAAIHLYAGALAYQSTGASSKLPSQTVGDVTLRAGRSGLGLVNGSGNFTLTLNSLTRENNATVNIFGLATAGAFSLKVTNDSNILADLVGSGTSATSTAIVPWATGRTTFTANVGNLTNTVNNFATNGLVTYTHDGGFRVLDTSEYAPTLAGSNDDDNVRITAAETLSDDKTVNALVGVNTTLTIANNTTLTVTSGVVARFGGNFTISGGQSMLNTGDRPLILYSDGSDFNIQSQIINTAATGLIAATGVGRTFLGGANSYTGATIVQSTLNLQNDKAIPVASALRIDSGGILLIDGGSRNVGAASLSGRGLLPFNSTASRFVLGGSADNRATELAGYVTVRENAFIAPGDADGIYQAGELTLGANILGVYFQEGSFFDVDLAGDTVSDLLAISSDNLSAPVLKFDEGAIIRLNYLDNYTPTADGEWLLTTGFASISGDLDNVFLKNGEGDDLSALFSLSSAGNNLLLTSIIPEPSTWLLLTVGATLLMTTRRRRR
ncbi:MAG: PEP-CTERM sorting domain-containing protein, partial [Verrucomicrobiales bacterium]|nr:PEP-CTERM sorting domain-containing protein [Verrucomicrobiales bacterium]